jgi:CDP-diacylglycerol--glycerol-3-phosphate 3-phosphatidyltransferase
MSSRVPGERREAMRDALIESRLTPNAISLTGFALCLVSAGLILADMIVLGGIAYIIGSICDTLDGRYSRMSGKGSPFGAFLDSTLDRVEEGVVLAALAYHFAEQGNGVEAAICAVAILASVMVSYTRARAEALGVDCKVGIGSRATRVVILSVGLLFVNGLGLGDFSLLAPAVILLAAIGIVTTLQRVFHVRGKLIRAAAAPEDQADL